MYPFRRFAPYTLLFVFCLTFMPGLVIAQTQPPPVYVEIRDFVEEDNRFVFVVALTNPERVHRLYVELWSQNQRVAPPKEYENPRPVVRDALPKELFRPSVEYELIVRAEDIRGAMIAVPTDRADGRPDTVLARFPFSYEIPEVEPIEFTVWAMQPNEILGKLRIELGGIDPNMTHRVQKVEGFIFDSNRQVVDRFQMDGLENLSLNVNLPSRMRRGQNEQKFTLEMQITSVEGLISKIVSTDITIDAIPKPTTRQLLGDAWLKLLAGIQAQPLIFIGIVIVLLNTFGWMLFRGGRKKHKSKIERPPIEPTGISLPVVSPRIQAEIIRSADTTIKKKLTFDESHIIIGRSSSANLTIREDRRLSSKHIEVRMSGKRIEIMDCHSKNGTFVDGRVAPPGEWMEVGSHETVTLGSRTEIRLSIRA